MSRAATGKAAHLARIAVAAAAPLALAEARVALLTGQSRLGSSALSPSQKTFLAAVAPGHSVMPCGFPFLPEADDRYEAPWLPVAALANARQALWCAGDDRYRWLAARALARLLGATGRSLTLVTGSCGLAIACAALEGALGADRVSLLALGPVGRAPARVGRFLAVQGTRDGWSRRLYRGPTPVAVGCAHLGYWEDEAVRGLARRFVAAGPPG